MAEQRRLLTDKTITRLPYAGDGQYKVLYPEQSEFWLFPADSISDHLVEHKEERTTLSKWSNDLRQSYRTLAQAAGVSELDIHLLMNHSLPGVNAGYITRDGPCRRRAPVRLRSAAFPG